MHKNTRGFLIVEVLLAIVIMSMVFLTLFTMLSFTVNRTERSKYDAQAAAVMQQGIEIARTSILASWSSYGNKNYYPFFDVDSSQWGLKVGDEGVLEGRFTRVITVSLVCRDNTIAGEGKELVCPLGKYDEQSKKIAVNVSWKEGNIEKKVEADLMLYKSK